MIKHVILWKLKDAVAHVAVANTKVRPFVETRLCLNFAE